jgi:hypothetical protein
MSTFFIIVKSAFHSMFYIVCREIVIQNFSGFDCSSSTMLFIYHKLKDGVMFRNYGFPFPSKIQMSFPFPRTSREIKTKPIRVNSNSVNQYSVPLHVSTYRQGDYNLQRLYNGRFVRLSAAAGLVVSCTLQFCLTAVHLQSSSLCVHTQCNFIAQYLIYRSSCRV